MLDFMTMYASLNSETPLAETEHTGTWANTSYDQTDSCTDFLEDTPAFIPDFLTEQIFTDITGNFTSSCIPPHQQYTHQPSQHHVDNNNNANSGSGVEDQDVFSPKPMFRQRSWAQVVQGVANTVQQQSRSINMAAQPFALQSPPNVNPTISTPTAAWWQEKSHQQISRTYAQAAAGNIPGTNSPLRQSISAYDNGTCGFAPWPFAGNGPASPSMLEHANKRPRYDNGHSDAPDYPSDLPGIFVDEQIKSNVNYSMGDSMQSVSTWNQATKVPGDRLLPPLKTQHLGGLNTRNGVSPTSSVASSARSRRTKGQMTSPLTPYALRCGECGAGFDTAADLRHHKRNHQPIDGRKHKCDDCDKRFLHPKDVRRHSKTHNKDPSSRVYCPHVRCKAHTKGFGRDDHLARHMRSQHGCTDSVVQESSTPSSHFDDSF